MTELILDYYEDKDYTALPCSNCGGRQCYLEKKQQGMRPLVCHYPPYQWVKCIKCKKETYLQPELKRNLWLKECLPCPFCGSSIISYADYELEDKNTYKSVSCIQCKASGPAIICKFSPEKTAILAWNTRTALKQESNESNNS